MLDLFVLIFTPRFIFQIYCQRKDQVQLSVKDDAKKCEFCPRLSLNTLAKLRRHASRVHFAKIHF